MVGLHGTEKSRNKTGKENFSSDDDEDETHLHAQSSMSLLHRVRGTKSKGVEYLVLVVLFVFLLLLLIWDMKTTSILSEIIHDDHADLWQHMNTSIINKWLSPLDFCMLKIDQANVDVRAYRQKNCTKLQGLNPPDSVKLFCGIGSSLGKPCTSPLSTRSFFKSHLIGTLGDPHNKLLRTSLRLMAEDKKVLVFIGDAISKQNQEATVCELMRTDRIIISGGSRASLNSTTSEFVIHWRDNPALSIEIIFLHVAHLNNDHSNRKNERHLQQRITNDSLQPKINSSNYAQNSPSITLSSATAHLDNLLVRFPGGVVIVANIGVWYNSREKFRNELPIFLRWLNSLGKDSKNLILFRETAAQHWNHTENGYFTLENNALEESSCVPIADSREDLDWRNRDVKFTIENEDLQNIRIIPFRDITAPLYDMHPDGVGSKDCTRYCYFPQMWQPVWWKIHNAINKTVDYKAAP